MLGGHTGEQGMTVMHMKPFKTLLMLAFAVTWLGGRTPCHGVSLSGIVLYGATDSGDPYTVGTLEGEIQADLWRTALGGEWHILGVWRGLPPQSWAARPLNGPDAMVDIPLSDGENDFTLVGQPGVNTAVDEYERFAINLYFDGVLDHPGISVLIPRYTNLTGSPVSQNRSDFIFSLGLQRVRFPPQTSYDNGVVSVSVTAASFLGPETSNLDVDLVQAQRLVPSGPSDPNGSDYIGVLKLTVAASPNSSAAPNTSAANEGCQTLRGGRSRNLILPSMLLVLVAPRWRRFLRTTRQLRRHGAGEGDV